VFAPSRHHRRNAGQVIASWARIRSPGSSSAKARTVSGISPARGSCSHGIAFGDPVIAASLVFLLQGRVCGPVGLISIAVGLHRAVVRLDERVLRFLAGAPQRGRQFMAVAAIPAGFHHRRSFGSPGC
jgi:hypothetical protein